MSKFIFRILMLWMLCSLMAGAEVPNARARQIQIALVHHGIPVPVTGRMDAKTTAALKRLAKENQWQTKRVPDARVLVMIGLGAKHNDLGGTLEAKR